MISSEIELRTLPGSIHTPKQAKDSLKKRNRTQRVVGNRITGGLNFKENHYSNGDKNMNKKFSPPPSPEPRKTGIREWLFGRTLKIRKPGKRDDSFEENDDVNYYTVTDNQADDDVDSGVEGSLDRSQVVLLTAKSSQMRGHCFEQHQGPTWCDLCEDFIWGIYKSASTRCRFCKYTCHIRCFPEVNLDCPKAPARIKSIEDVTKETLDILNESNGKESVESKSKLALPSYVSSIEELREMITEYNKGSTLIMTLQEDGTFHGFVRVHMNMARPVNLDANSGDLSMRKAIKRSNSRRSRRSTTPNRMSVKRTHSTAQPIAKNLNTVAEDRPYGTTPHIPSSQESLVDSDGSYLSAASSITSTSSSIISSIASGLPGISSLLAPSDSTASSIASSSSGISSISSGLSGVSSLLVPSDSSPVVPRQVDRRQLARRRYSFYMPKNSNKPLHITSKTTVRQVIEALLDKYNVTDNPRKFALYEKTEEKEQNVLRKMNDDECPLVLSLMWISKTQVKSFSLQENERGEIDWEAFEFPELRNFLVFLNNEEEDMVSQLKKKYDAYRSLLDEVITHHEMDRSDSNC